MKKFFSKFDATFEQPQSNFIGKVFNVGRQTVTVDEMIAEGESVHKQGGHGTGKTENLAVNFSRQGKHREFSQFYFLHRENCANTGKILKI